MKKFILSTLVLVLSLIAVAQQPQPLPIDSAVRVGKLENGPTYYIRHNEYPKQRAEFIVTNVISQTILQLTHAHCRINRQWLWLLRCHRERQRQHESA